MTVVGYEEMGVGVGVKERGLSPEQKLGRFMENWVARKFSGLEKESKLGMDLAETVGKLIPAITDRNLITAEYRKIERVGNQDVLESWRGVMGEVGALQMFVDWWGQGNVYTNRQLDMKKVDGVTLVNPPEGADYDYRVIGWQFKVADEFEAMLLDTRTNDQYVGNRGNREVRLEPQTMREATRDFIETVMRRGLGIEPGSEVEIKKSGEDPGILLFTDDESGETVRIKIDVGYIGISVEPVVEKYRADSGAWIDIKNGKRIGGYERMEDGRVVDIGKAKIFKLLGLPIKASEKWLN